MKNLHPLFYTLLISILTINAQETGPLDDILKKIENGETQSEEVSLPTKTELEKTETSNIQNQVAAITEELKKINTELKTIIGPNAEKLISESQKRRQERQKEAERKLKERRSGAGGYFPSSYGGGKSSYPGYGSSGYGSSSYTPSHSRSSSGGGFGGGFGDKAPWDTDFEQDKFGAGQDKAKTSASSSSSGLKLDDTGENKSDKKRDRSGSSASDKDLIKEERSALKKAKNNTQAIKEILKQIMTNLSEVQTSQETGAAATRQIYSNLLTEGQLTELDGLLKSRTDASRNMSTEKPKTSTSMMRARIASTTKSKTTQKFVIDQEEKSLWQRFLPHLIKLLVFEPDAEDLAAATPQNVTTCKRLISSLEKEKLVSRSEIKQEQEKIENQMISDLRETFKTSKNKKTPTMIKIAKKAHNLYLPKDKPLMDLLELVERLAPEMEEK